MARVTLALFGWLLILVLAAQSAFTQEPEPGPRVLGNAPDEAESQPGPPSQEAAAPAAEAAPTEPEKKPRATEKSALERIWATLSQEEDPDGPINTDRPTFTPANTVVPRRFRPQRPPRRFLHRSRVLGAVLRRSRTKRRDRTRDEEARDPLEFGQIAPSDIAGEVLTPPGG